MVGYAYDTNGQSSFFILTVLALFLVPLTYSALFGSSSKRASKVPPPCKGWNVKTSDAKRAAPSGLSIKHLVLAIGWLGFGFVVQQALLFKPDVAMYDPYEILGIATGATEKVIKKHYRKLSLKFHPDKLVLAANQTKEEAESVFVELTKAYKALTDEVTRQNFEQYGHPDGKQDFSQGIAIPSWIVESKNMGWVIGAYGLVLGIMLPFFVGRWWYGSRKRTKDGILNSTAETFFKQLAEETSIPDLLNIISSADEFIDNPVVLKARKKPGKGAVDEYARLTSLARERTPKWEGYNTWSVSKKRARVILSAHMLRLPSSDSQMRLERMETVDVAVSLLKGLASVALARSWLTAYITIIRLQQLLIQAVDTTSSPLLQLPYVDDEIVNGCKDIGVFTIEQFRELPIARVKKLMHKLPESNAVDALEVAKHWPISKLESVKFEVVGEKTVNPGSFMTCTIKLRIPPVGEDLTPNLENTRVTGQNLQGKEKSINEIIGRYSAKEDGVVPISVAHAPHFPKSRKPTWYIFVGDHKINRIFVQPQSFTDVGENVTRTIRLTFQGPQGPGLYTFQVYVMNDSFVGTDLQSSVKFSVVPPTDKEEDEEDEISDPDEESFAGQMALLRGQNVRKIEDDTEDEEEDSDESSSSSSDSDSD